MPHIADRRVPHRLLRGSDDHGNIDRPVRHGHRRKSRPLQVRMQINPFRIAVGKRQPLPRPAQSHGIIRLAARRNIFRNLDLGNILRRAVFRHHDFPNRIGKKRHRHPRIGIGVLRAFSNIVNRLPCGFAGHFVSRNAKGPFTVHATRRIHQHNRIHRSGRLSVRLTQKGTREQKHQQGHRQQSREKQKQIPQTSPAHVFLDSLTQKTQATDLRFLIPSAAQKMDQHRHRQCSHPRQHPCVQNTHQYILDRFSR